MSKKYVPPHLRGKSTDLSTSSLSSLTKAASSPRNSTDRSKSSSLSAASAPSRDKEVIFFGDSFIRMFTLVKNRDIRVEAFKGASAKGLTRDGNQNRDKIIGLVQKVRPKRVIFCFGSVDIHHSWFYKLVVKEEVLDIKLLATEYVKFCARFKESVPPERIHVVGIYPSPLEDSDVRESLFLYGAVPEDQVDLIPDDEIALEARQARVCVFNETVKDACESYGLKFESVYEEVTDKETNKMKDVYRDISDKNVHIVWETTMMLWLSRWPWLKALTPPHFEADFEKTLHEYLETKPWAEREHLASKLGIKAAVAKGSSH